MVCAGLKIFLNIYVKTTVYVSSILNHYFNCDGNFLTTLMGKRNANKIQRITKYITGNSIRE